MKVRIYKTPDGEVVVDTPAMRYQNENFDKCPHPGRFRNGEPFEMEVKELSELEAIAVDNESGSAQFYYEGKKLKHDSGWNELLMPKSRLVSRRKKRLEENLDSELAKTKPNQIKCIRFQRQLQKLKKISDKALYQDALDNLPSDKPKIREKLLAKLKDAD